jgi:hypothetical protein
MSYPPVNEERKLTRQHHFKHKHIYPPLLPLLQVFCYGMVGYRIIMVWSGTGSSYSHIPWYMPYIRENPLKLALFSSYLDRF